MTFLQFFGPWLLLLAIILIIVAIATSCGPGLDEFHYGELDYCDGRDIAVRGIDRDRGVVFEIWCDRVPYQRESGQYDGIHQDDFGPEDYSMGWVVDD